MGPKSNGSMEQTDAEELGLHGLAFLHTPVALIVLDDDNKVVASNIYARRLVYPSRDSTKPWARGTTLRNLPFKIPEDDSKRSNSLDQLLEDAREGLEDSQALTHTFSVVLQPDRASTPANVDVGISSVRTSRGARFTNLVLSLGAPDTISTVNKASARTGSLLAGIFELKETILDHMHELAVFCMTKDGEMPVLNKAGQAFLDGAQIPPKTKAIKWLYEKFLIYDEDFTKQITFDEWGVNVLFTTGDSIRQTIGYYDPNGKSRVFELSGEPIKDDDGQLVAGIFWLKDETALHKKGEAAFKQICDSMPQLMFVMSADREVPEWFNKTWYEFTGLSQNDDFDVPEILKIICHEEDFTYVLDAWNSGIQTREHIEVHFRCRRQDGEYRWMLGRSQFTLDDNGQLLKWFGAITDVHEQTEAVEEAQRLKHQLVEVIRHTQLGIITIDNSPDYRISILEGAPILINLPGVVVGARLKDAFKSMPQFFAPVERILKHGETSGDITQELEYQGKWYRCRFTPMMSRMRVNSPGLDNNVVMNGHAVEGVVLVAADVTSRRMSDLALEMTHKEKSEMEERESAALKTAKLKADFLANASHEIRTPISQIIGMSEVMMDTELLPEQRNYTKNILDSASSLKNLISDILDLSKIEAGKMTISNAPFDLSSLLSSIVDMFKLTTSQKGLQFEHLSTLQKEDGYVVGDQGRVRQILTNLLGNAFKFTSDGFIHMTTILTRDQPNPDSIVNIKFIVEDSGIGITDAAIKKLFLPFTQADETTSSKFGGTGLGLSISKELAELMHGKIALERSKGGPGCVAWFSIPFQRYKGEIEVDVATLKANQEMINRFRFDIEKSLYKNDDTAIPGPNQPSSSSSRLRHVLPARSPGSKVGNMSHMLPPSQSQAGPSKRSSLAAQTTQLLQGVKVVLVEDDQTIRIVAVRNLQLFGCRVTEAKNGREGLASIEHALACGELPDIVFTDCRMPEMDGYELTRRIRAHPEPSVRKLIVIAMTAATLSEEQDKCEQVGMTDFLGKPAKREELFAILVKYVGQKAPKSS